MTAGNDAFRLEEGTGWTRGLNNLLDAELGRWYRTRKWWVQILVWAAIINLILLMVAFSEESPGVDELVMLFSIFMGIFAAVGVCIIMQGTIVREKQDGTAAWVLSKPASRQAFVLAKLIANSIGIIVTIVLVQGAIAYAIISLASGVTLSPLAYLAGLGIHVVNLFFYITLTLMLGALFSNRGIVIGLPLVFLFAQQFLIGLIPALADFLPFTLTVPLDGSSYPSIASAVMTGEAVPTVMPVVATLGFSLLFVAVGLWAFDREEL